MIYDKIFDKGLKVSKHYGARDIVRNPSLLHIDPDETVVIEDKKSHKMLGLYIGVDLAKEFERYRRKRRLLDAANKIKHSALDEAKSLETTLDDGL